MRQMGTWGLMLLVWLGFLIRTGSAQETPRTGPSWDMSHGPLKVSSNGRFLVHEDGTPFFYLGDTAWELFHRLNREDAERYLENRRGKGFTVIQAVCLAELDGLNTPNPYGDRPLTNNNPATPATTPGNDPGDATQYDYWDHVDYIVERARAKGIYIGMLPTWGSHVESGVLNAGNAEAYGRFLGQRYAGKPILWILGGDRSASGYEAVWRALAKGIAIGVSGSEDYSKVLMTFHPPGGGSSASWFHHDAWLDFNMLQTGHCYNDSYSMIVREYNRTPGKPVMDGEPMYEDHPICFNTSMGYATDVEVRRYAYWNLFAGAHGHTYGCHNIWQMYAPGRSPISWARKYWYDSLDLPGAWHMMHLRNLILSRPFLSRVPDQSIVADAYTGNDHLRATRGDGYAFVYAPTGRNFTVNLGKISGTTVRAHWWNPRDGSSTVIGDYANSGTLGFTPPSSGRGNDWVLVLDDTSRGFPAPGRGTTPPPAPGGETAGVLLREWWTRLPGTAVTDLTGNPAYAGPPSGSDTPASFEAPTNWADEYGQRMRGYLIPPATGDYYFWIASDDNGELWLSTDDRPVNKVRIARVPGWTNSREWTKYPEQASVAIRLEAGRKYYVEALQKEGSGGDNLAVGWRLPNGTLERPIPGSRLMSPSATIDSDGDGASDADEIAAGTNPNDPASVPRGIGGSDDGDSGRCGASGAEALLLLVLAGALRRRSLAT